MNLLEKQYKNILLLKDHGQNIVDFYPMLKKQLEAKLACSRIYLAEPFTDQAPILWISNKARDFVAFQDLDEEQLRLARTQLFKGFKLWSEYLQTLRDKGNHRLVYILEEAFKLPHERDKYTFYSKSQEAIVFTAWGSLETSDGPETLSWDAYLNKHYDEIFIPTDIPQGREQVAPVPSQTAVDREMDERLVRENASKGSVNISLSWNDKNDLDLHLYCPGGKKIYFNSREACGGKLDVDMNCGGDVSDKPVENIFFAQKPKKAGRYSVYVHHFNHYTGQPSQSEYMVRLDLFGDVKLYRGSISPQKQNLVCSFDID